MPEAFEVGRNVGTTEGAVVFENDLFQLIQYTPTTEKVAAEPLLYVPPLVNRYYMIDLVPRQSLVKWLVDEGRTVFVSSHLLTEVEVRFEPSPSGTQVTVVHRGWAAGFATCACDPRGLPGEKEVLGVGPAAGPQQHQAPPADAGAGDRHRVGQAALVSVSAHLARVLLAQERPAEAPSGTAPPRRSRVWLSERRRRTDSVSPSQPQIIRQPPWRRRSSPSKTPTRSTARSDSGSAPTTRNGADVPSANSAVPAVALPTTWALVSRNPSPVKTTPEPRLSPRP